jgi:hypothetical protein
MFAKTCPDMSRKDVPPAELPGSVVPRTNAVHSDVPPTDGPQSVVPEADAVYSDVPQTDAAHSDVARTGVPRAGPRRVLIFGLLSVLGAVAYVVVIGTVTAVIPNPLFDRMTPVTVSNLVFWIVPAVLFGPLMASYVVPVTRAACATGERTLAGGVLPFLAVGCPLCNKLVVLALGAGGALAYFEPVQPVLGLASVALLGYALWLRFGRPLGKRSPGSPSSRSD